MAKVELHVDDNIFHSAITKATNEYLEKKGNAIISKWSKERIDNSIKKQIEDGTLLNRVATLIAKEICIDDIMTRVDVEAIVKDATTEITKRVVERLTNRVSNDLFEKFTRK